MDDVIYESTHGVSILMVSDEAFCALFLLVLDQYYAPQPAHSMVWVHCLYSYFAYNFFKVKSLSRL